MIFPVVMYGCECWAIKKGECQRVDAFELWCWRRLLRVLWTARRSNQSILKEISSVQIGGSVMSDSATPWTTTHQASLSITISQSLPKPMSIESVMPFNHLILCHPLLLLPSFFLSIRVFSNEPALHIRWLNIGISASTSVLPMNTQDWSPLGWTGWISLPSKGLQSSPTPQFKSINFSVLSFLHSPTLTSIHDHWKNHSLD